MASIFALRISAPSSHIRWHCTFLRKAFFLSRAVDWEITGCWDWHISFLVSSHKCTWTLWAWAEEKKYRSPIADPDKKLLFCLSLLAMQLSLKLSIFLMMRSGPKEQKKARKYEEVRITSLKFSCLRFKSSYNFGFQKKKLWIPNILMFNVCKSSSKVKGHTGSLRVLTGFPKFALSRRGPKPHISQAHALANIDGQTQTTLRWVSGWKQCGKKARNKKVFLRQERKRPSEGLHVKV